MRLTFKRDKAGRYYEHVERTRAYLDGMEFLTFEPVRGANSFRVRMQVDLPAEKITEEAPCPWHWVTFSKVYPSLDDAKAYVKNNRSMFYSKLATAVKKEIETL